MIDLIRSLIAPLTSLILLILGSGLFNTFVSIRLEMNGFDVETIGLVISALYVGILIGSLKVGRWIEIWGHSLSFIIFASISTVLILFQSFWIDPWYWAFLRLIGGICMAGIFVTIESWLLLAASPSFRGAVLSLYLAVFYTALSLGQLLIYFCNIEGLSPFFLTASLTALSILPVSGKKNKLPKLEESSSMHLKNFFKLSPLGFMGGVVSGMLLAIVYGLLPVYATDLGLSADQIGTLMAILIFGGLSLQWPIGRLADKGKRKFVLNAASFISSLLAAAIALQQPIHPTSLSIFIWFFGGFSFTLYPLSMAYVCEKIQTNQIVSATGGFVLSYGIGAIFGPIFGSVAMQQVGPSGLFYFLSFITLLLGSFGLYSRCNTIAPQESESTEPKS